jgi:hypothetical protein
MLTEKQKKDVAVNILLMSALLGTLEQKKEVLNNEQANRIMGLFGKTITDLLSEEDEDLIERINEKIKEMDGDQIKDVLFETIIPEGHKKSATEYFFNF